MGFACGAGFCSTDLIVLWDVPPESVEAPALPPPTLPGLAALISAVVGNFFTELGIDVIDADHVSKNIL